jgi:cytochrome oxidase Cu insertion factor (SCO1/SenC/PrrC family)
MLKKVVWGLLLLAGLASVGGCLGQVGETGVTPTTMNVDLPASTPAATTANVLDPAPTPCDTCPDKGQPTVTDTPTPSVPVAPVPGAQAPDFTLTDLDGDEVTLGELRGQVVLLNFWATW